MIRGIRAPHFSGVLRASTIAQDSAIARAFALGCVYMDVHHETAFLPFCGAEQACQAKFLGEQGRAPCSPLFKTHTASVSYIALKLATAAGSFAAVAATALPSAKAVPAATN